MVVVVVVVMGGGVDGVDATWQRRSRGVGWAGVMTAVSSEMTGVTLQYPPALETCLAIPEMSPRGKGGGGGGGRASIACPSDQATTLLVSLA